MLKAKVSQLATATSDIQIFFKRSKSAVQTQFVELTPESFVAHLRHRWSKISQGDLQKWEDENKTPAEGMRFEVFLYVPKENRRQAGIRRATANRIRQAATRIRDYESNNDVRLGEIQRNHLQIHFARQPEGTEITIPNDNTNRQASALDEEMAVLENENMVHFLLPVGYLG